MRNELSLNGVPLVSRCRKVTEALSLPVLYMASDERNLPTDVVEATSKLEAPFLVPMSRPGSLDLLSI